VIIEGAPALMHKSKIKCAKGGVISIQKHNQCLESDGAVVLPVKEPAKQEIKKTEKNNDIINYQITQDFLTKNKYSRPKTPIIKVKGVVIHWVANAGSTAKQNRDYFESLKVGKKIYVKNEKNELIWNGKYVYASAHYIVDLDGSIIQALPEDEVAYHVGSEKYKKVVEERLENRPNSLTLGIEMTHIDNVGNFTNDTYRSTTILAAKLLAKYNLNPYKDLYRHYDITGKDCPKLFVTNTEKWLQFVKDVADIME
jgi:N-acetylmuramoyl-L-alanine amidase